MNDMSGQNESSQEDSVGSFTTRETESVARANESQNAGGESVAGCPAQENDDCTRHYNAERHKFTERHRHKENVPSAGWREVYYSMGVSGR